MKTFDIIAGSAHARGHSSHTFPVPNYVWEASRRKFVNNCQIIKPLIGFYKSPKVEVLNEYIAGIELFKSSAAIDEEEFLMELYETKDQKRKDALLEALAMVGQRKPLYTSPHVLAFAHAVVENYPDVIPDISNPLLVERAFKFMAGHYLHIVERPNIPIYFNVNFTEGAPEYIPTRLLWWLDSCVDAAVILTALYSATGDEKYLTTMDAWSMFQNSDIHRRIAAGEEVVLGPRVNTSLYSEDGVLYSHGLENAICDMIAKCDASASE